MSSNTRHPELWRQDQQGSRTAGAGRHTLGSDHDTSRTPAPGHSTVGSARPAFAHLDAIMRPVWWRSAEERVRSTDGEAGRLLRKLFDHVERGWGPVGALQVASEGIGESRAVDERVAMLVAFTLRDVVGAFRQCALSATALVPGTTAQVERIPSTQDAADTFERYLHVLQLAAVHPAVPDWLAVPSRDAAEALAGWAAEFGVLGTASAALNAPAALP